MKSIKKRLKSWEIGNYIRQLSIVVMGIVITFIGSDLFSGCTKKKEIKSVMNLIKNELRDNQQQLKNIKKVSMIEMEACSVFASRNYNYDGIPNDTLVLYFKTLNSMNKLKYTVQSLEVLKNSSLMQYIPDKVFVSDLINTYAYMQELEARMSYYLDRKDRLWNQLLDELTIQEIAMLNMTDMQGVYSVLFSSQKMKNWIFANQGFFSEKTFDEQFDKMEALIKEIDRKYP